MGFFSDLDQVDTQATKALKKSGFFGDLADEPSRTRSLLSAFPKGAFKGAHSLGKLTDPTAFFTGSEIEPMQAQALESVLPTQKGKFAEGALETAGEMAPSFALGGEGLFTKALQIGAGALTKQTLKEANAPELVQEIGGAIGATVPQVGKGLLSSKILPKANQKEIYDFLKGYGFNDKEITPFIQSPKKARWLAKSARSFLDPEKFKEETKPVGELIYSAIKEKQQDLPPLSGLKKVAFLQQLNSKLDEIPYTYSDLIKKDIKKLKSSQLTFKDMRDFEAALNHKIGAAEGGKQVLGILKEPINFGERMLSPELYKEKQLINQAYKSRMDIYERLPDSAKGSLLEKAGKLGPIGGIALAYTFGLPLTLKGLALKKGADYAAMKALTSPRFQNMQGKLLESLKSGNKGAIIRLISKMQDETDKFTSSSLEKEPRDEDED